MVNYLDHPMRPIKTLYELIWPCISKRRSIHVLNLINFSPNSYEMMRKCWRVDPKERPTFEDIGEWIQDMLMDNEVQIRYELLRIIL